MKIELDDEECRQAISLLLEQKGIIILDSTIKWYVDDAYGTVEFSAEVERISNQSKNNK